jgi:hypothetical protein
MFSTLSVMWRVDEFEIVEFLQQKAYSKSCDGFGMEVDQKSFK